MRIIRPTVGFVLALLVLPSCTKDNPAFDEPGPICADNEVFSGQTFNLPVRDKLDFIVILDTSSEQSTFHSAFADDFTQELGRLSDEGVDWQVGVVTNDMMNSERRGQVQSFRNAEGCADLPESPLVDVAMSDALSLVRCNLQPSEVGAENGEALDAARRASIRAQREPDSANAGLLRSGALPVYLFVGATPDCSGSGESRQVGECLDGADDLTPIAEYSRLLLRDIPADRSPFIASPTIVTISGPDGVGASQHCEDIEVEDGSRLAALARSARDSGFQENICAASFAPIISDSITSARSRARVCLARELARNPFDVTIEPGSAQETALHPFGDWIAIRPGEGCYNGGIDINADVFSGESREVRIRFCRVEDSETE